MRSREYLRKQAEKCRRLAAQLANSPVANELVELAAEYEAEAADQQMQAQDDAADDQGKQQED
jgi:hypothetical protein